jgi:hypothetical protein
MIVHIKTKIFLDFVYSFKQNYIFFYPVNNDKNLFVEVLASLIYTFKI